GAFGNHHALREQSPGRFAVLNEADIAHHSREEARVDQMQNRVFHAADVLIDLKPVSDFGGVEGRLGIVWIAVAVEVPGTVHEGVHGIGLAPGSTAAPRACDVDELGNVFKRRTAGAGDIDTLGQDHRELLFRDRHYTVRWAVNYGDGCAPVTLPGDAPVLDAIGDRG